jgi:hypothetical protein
MRRLACLSLLPLALFPGCTCGDRTAPTTPPASAASTSASASAGAASSASPAASVAPSNVLDPGVFSAPIGAARSSKQDVVAGLVAAEHLVRVVGVVGDKPAWGVNALRDVTWAPDAEVRVLSAGDAGVVVVWHGQHAGKTGRTLVIVGPHGELRGEPMDVGGGFCATADGLAWIDPGKSGPARVMARSWAEGSPGEALRISSDRDPALACGDHLAFALGDGDDDLTAASFAPGSPAKAPTVVVRDADFGEDDEREHDVYTIGDDLALLRAASSGALALRTVPHGAGPTPWHRLSHSIPPDDDVVAVDGDASASFVVYTHDADEACPGIGSTAIAVRAIRIDGKTSAETVMDLAAADCDHAPGPFFVAASSPGGATVGWVERGTKLAKSAPPITGVALRTWSAAGPAKKHVDLSADAVADAGCDASGCSFAALVRPEGGDGMSPEAVRVFAYP